MSIDCKITYNKIIDLIAEQLNISKDIIKSESSLESLGADSLARVEIIMKLEEEFEIEINDDEAENITTIQQAVDYICKLQSQSQK